jgi:hypothetical protein
VAARLVRWGLKVGQATVGKALLGAALLAQLATPAGLAAPAGESSPVMPVAMLDAQEDPAARDDEEMLDEPAAEAAQATTAAPEDDTETLDTQPRPADSPPAPVSAAPAPAAGPVPAPPVEPAPAAAPAPVAAAPVPAAAADSYGDSYGDSYSGPPWPFNTGGSVYVNAGYGPGEANAAAGFNTCKYRVSNGRAYVGVHCSGGDLVSGFTPPPWQTGRVSPFPGALPVSDDFWSRVSGQGGVVRVPAPAAVTVPEGATVIEGRSRERVKTTTITRNGVSETVTNSGKNNQVSGGGRKASRDRASDSAEKSDKKSKRSSEQTISQRSGSGQASNLAGQTREPDAKDKREKRKRKRDRQVADVATMTFAECVQRAIKEQQERSSCGDLIRDEIDASLERSSSR